MSTGDFDVRSLAIYLHTTPDRVLRLAERGNIPGRKVGGQWRFSRAEIHHWLERRMGVSDDAELAAMEDTLAPQNASTPSLSVADMLPVEAIEIPLQARTKNSVIRRMVELAANTGWLWDVDAMADAVAKREELYPTALENGAALLHPRRPMSSILGEAFLAFGRTARGIPFGSDRGVLTDCFFLICSVDDRGHLRTLARLSRLMANPYFLPQLREVDDPHEVRRLIAEFEAKL